jgi:hypothetical protein
VTAFAVAVDDVVVEQREVVDELDRDRTGYPVPRVGARGLRRQHGQRGADPLAPGARTGRPVLVAPAEVVGRDPPELGVEPPDGCDHGRVHHVAGTGERIRN